MCEWNRCFNNGINGMEYSERRCRICARFYIFASGEVVAFEGATPVFYDVCQDTFNANVSSLEKCITM